LQHPIPQALTQDFKAFMLETVQREFETNAAAAGMERAQKALAPALVELVTNRFDSMLPGIPWAAASAPEALKALAQPMAVVIGKGTETVSHEKGFVGSCRLGWVGTREMIVAPAASLIKFCEATAPPGTKVTMKTIKDL
jgi:hypothetical protein